MKLYKYKSYEEYVREQMIMNHRKLDRISADKKILNTIADYIIMKIPNVNFGICHGVRNAWEVKMFRNLLRCKVIGTEISDTAIKFEHTIRWDFHNVKEEWINNVDFIYSNSLDHSYDPEYCLKQWVKCLNKTGICFIEWSIMCEVPKGGLAHMKADCFGADLREYRELISKNFRIIDELEMVLDTEWVKKRGMNDKRIIFAINKL